LEFRNPGYEQGWPGSIFVIKNLTRNIPLTPAGVNPALLLVPLHLLNESLMKRGLRGPRWPKKLSGEIGYFCRTEIRRQTETDLPGREVVFPIGVREIRYSGAEGSRFFGLTLSADDRFVYSDEVK
jgi:hypothetical protein